MRTHFKQGLMLGSVMLCGIVLLMTAAFTSIQPTQENDVVDVPMVVIGHDHTITTPTFDMLEEAVTCFADAMTLPVVWRLNIEYVTPDTTRDAYAWTTADAMYRTATLAFDTTYMFAALTTEQIRQTVIHELSHVWLWELAEIGQRQEERHGLMVEEQTISFIERWPLWANVCHQLE